MIWKLKKEDIYFKQIPGRNGGPFALFVNVNRPFAPIDFFQAIPG